MAKIYTHVAQLIGGTPLVAFDRIVQAHGAHARILAKLECMNPAGSAKDRAALSMIEEAERTGRLTPGATIIEPTSGNTGIGLASVAVPRGYRVIMTMPETMSLERRRLIAAYGAEIVLTSGKLGMQGAVDKAEELKRDIPGSIIAGQFVNPANPAAHYKTTGPEIWQDTDGDVDVFVAGVGTGGTISGAGRYLKEHKPDVHIVAVEPADSPLLSQGKAGPHGIQGIGANFVPEALDRTVYDEVRTVETADATAMAREIARTEGILVGISSGAAVSAALALAKQPAYAGKTIVVMLPDTGERYLSTGIFD
ncbi:MAG TPA: cysteine synthase A [Candidatus Butyricicoccus avicola]|nr:cysteine synthase A [Candidatus Butyricicoccus avicola]